MSWVLKDPITESLHTALGPFQNLREIATVESERASDPDSVIKRSRVAHELRQLCRPVDAVDGVTAIDQE